MQRHILLLMNLSAPGTATVIATIIEVNNPDHPIHERNLLAPKSVVPRENTRNEELRLHLNHLKIPLLHASVLPSLVHEQLNPRIPRPHPSNVALPPARLGE